MSQMTPRQPEHLPAARALHRDRRHRHERIALVLHQLGVRVQGSDLKEYRYTRMLAAAGVPVAIGHREDNLGEAAVVVVSSAVPRHNPELRAAEQRGIPVLRRAEMLARLMALRRGISVAGTHGKTTTSSMVSHVLHAAGLDPTYVIGGELNDMGSNAGAGPGRVARGRDRRERRQPAVPAPRGRRRHEPRDGPPRQLPARWTRSATSSAASSPCCPNTAAWCSCEGTDTEFLRAEIARAGRHRRHRRRRLAGRGRARSTPCRREFVVRRDGRELGVRAPQGRRRAQRRRRSRLPGLVDHCGVAFERGGGAAWPPSAAPRAASTRSAGRRASSSTTTTRTIPTEVEAAIKSAKLGDYKRVIAVFQPHLYSRTRYFQQRARQGAHARRRGRRHRRLRGARRARAGHHRQARRRRLPAGASRRARLLHAAQERRRALPGPARASPATSSSPWAAATSTRSPTTSSPSSAVGAGKEMPAPAANRLPRPVPPTRAERHGDTWRSEPLPLPHAAVRPAHGGHPAAARAALRVGPAGRPFAVERVKVGGDAARSPRSRRCACCARSSSGANLFTVTPRTSATTLDKLPLPRRRRDRPATSRPPCASASSSTDPAAYVLARDRWYVVADTRPRDRSPGGPRRRH